MHREYISADKLHKTLTFKKFFYPVDPHNAAEVSLFMSLYTEHKSPKHLKAFQTMAANWNTLKWVQRHNPDWLGIIYKDGVQLRNFHRSMSDETGRSESLKLAGLLHASPPSSPSLPPQQSVADVSAAKLSAPIDQAAGLPAEPAAAASTSIGQPAALHGSGSQPAAHFLAPSQASALLPSPNPGRKKKLRSAATPAAAQGTLWPTLGAPGAGVGSGPSTSAKVFSTMEADCPQQTCAKCWLWDWWKACKEAPRFHGPGRVDPWSIGRIVTTSTGHKKLCPHTDLYQNVFMAKQHHPQFSELQGGYWTLFDKAKKKKAEYRTWLERTPAGWKRP